MGEVKKGKVKMCSGVVFNSVILIVAIFIIGFYVVQTDGREK